MSNEKMSFCLNYHNILVNYQAILLKSPLMQRFSTGGNRTPRSTPAVATAMQEEAETLWL